VRRSQREIRRQPHELRKGKEYERRDSHPKRRHDLEHVPIHLRPRDEQIAHERHREDHLGQHEIEEHRPREVVVPLTLDAYLRTVVTQTLERQRKEGCIAVKFEAAYLRRLDFAPASPEDAARIYAKYVAGGKATPA